VGNTATVQENSKDNKKALEPKIITLVIEISVFGIIYLETVDPVLVSSWMMALM
jgi:hypothetical protein